MLPLGRTWVTSAASVRLIDSERLIAPLPTLEVSEPIFTRLVGSAPCGKALASSPSRPKKLVRFASSELVRERVVVFDSLATSATVTFTVMMSPGRLARGSWKKLREPTTQSEFVVCCGGGAGSGTAGARAVTGENATAIWARPGVLPIFSRRVTAVQ